MACTIYLTSCFFTTRAFCYFNTEPRQCYSKYNCQGSSFSVVSAKECCVGDDGMSYSVGTTCIVLQCIGKTFHNIVSSKIILAVFGVASMFALS